MDCLQELKKENISTAVGSASKNAPRILERIQLQDNFDTVVDGNHISFSKPNPEVFLRCGQNLKLSPEDCLVIEDAEAGIVAAKAAGMKVIGVGAAFGSSKADYTAKDLTQLSIDHMRSLFV